VIRLVTSFDSADLCEQCHWISVLFSIGLLPFCGVFYTLVYADVGTVCK